MVLQQKRAKWPGMEGKRWQRERERNTLKGGVCETLEVAERETGRSQAAGIVEDKQQKLRCIPSLSAARPPW
jgi:hypothetical protein